ADPNASLTNGETPLMAASRTGSVEVVNMLLARAASIDATERRSGQTALMWSAANRHSSVTRALVEHKADIRVRSVGGFTALLFAARSGDVDSARALIGAGADVNEQTPDGSSALLIATASAQERAAVLLLDEGANPNVADANGYAPLHAIAWKAS